MEKAMKTFEKRTLINCNIDELFNFHLDMRNLKAITPSDTKVKILSKNFKPHQDGIVKIRIIKYFVPIIWEMKIDKLKSPSLLVDVAVKSPFKYFEHSHVFTQKGKQCELKDLIEYKLPLGKIGSLFDFLIKNEFKKMFNYRHKVTKDILENKK